MSTLPLAGRRLWLVGIGGTGMSALATVARAWGAEVAGSDRELTPYAKRLAEQGVDVVVGHARENIPEGWEVVASSAILPGNPELVPGARRRGELLAELVALRPSIVVAGAHGKTTTSAMIAFVLDRLGLDPSFLIGGHVPQLGGNGRAGGGWLVAEGDESDRSLALLRPRIAVITNVDFDHHATYGSLADVARFYEAWIASLDADSVVIRGEALEPATLELGVPGAHNRANAACALAALEAAGIERDRAAEVLVEYRGATRRFELHGEVLGVRVYDDYGHHPAEVAAALDTARVTAGARGRVLAVLQPHLYSRTRYLHRELAEALAAADLALVTEVCGAREAPVPGVTGRLVLDDLVALRPGMQVCWTPGFDDVARMIRATAREGDVVVTLGCGDIYRAIPGILERLRDR